MKTLCFLFLMQWPAYTVSAPSVQPQTMISPITPAKIRNMIAGGAAALLEIRDGVGDSVGEAYCALAGVGVGAVHCEAGTNEKPRNKKKWISKNETNAAPIAPEM